MDQYRPQPAASGERGTITQRRHRGAAVRLRPPAHIAQSVERVLGKNEVSGSNPDVGSRHDLQVQTTPYLKSSAQRALPQRSTTPYL